MQARSVEIVVGVFVLIGIVCVGYLTFKLGKMELIGSSDHYTVYARFLSVTGLKNGANVEMAGVQVGQVDSINLDPERLVALVGLKIRNEIVLSDDTIASVKTEGLIGDKYIKLSPGGSDDLLKQGAMISDTESALDIEELVSRFVFGSVDK